MKSFTEKLTEHKNVMALREALQAMVEVGIDLNEFVEWFDAKGANYYVSGRLDEFLGNYLQSKVNSLQQSMAPPRSQPTSLRGLKRQGRQDKKDLLNRSVMDLEAAINNLYKRANVSTNINVILGKDLATNLMRGLQGLRNISNATPARRSNQGYGQRQQQNQQQQDFNWDDEMIKAQQSQQTQPAQQPQLLTPSLLTKHLINN